MSTCEQSLDKASNSSTRRNSLDVPYLDESIFNSKIFIHLNRINDDSLNNSYFQEYDNCSESDTDTNQEISTDYFLSELVEKIDHPCLNTPKNFDGKLSFEEEKISKEENLNKTLVPLINKGYSFIPKNYQEKQNIKIEIDSKIHNKKTGSFKKKIKFQERKGDWTCNRCHNINFAFRNKCNRCKALKEESGNTN